MSEDQGIEDVGTVDPDKGRDVSGTPDCLGKKEDSRGYVIFCTLLTQRGLSVDTASPVSTRVQTLGVRYNCLDRNVRHPKFRGQLLPKVLGFGYFCLFALV